MSCAHVRLPDGSSVIACFRGGKRVAMLCACGRTATLLCDGITGDGADPRTCSRPICSSCATSPKPGKDYCPLHRPPQLQLDLDERIGA